MKDRIISFLKEQNLTSTKFADIIGVQRSSISHILSGRNKPSYDFIEKMLISFPSLNAQWLITGKGSMFNNQPQLFTPINKTEQNNSTQRELFIQNSVNKVSEISNSKQEIEKSEILPEKVTDEKLIDRIVIFFKDGSFKSYNPK